jgi:poly(hydroxyalkanoate) granule-associated protein
MDQKPDVGAMVKDVRTHSRAAAKSMAELTRAVLLSGVGAAGLAMDETKALLDKLVERGEIAEKDARKMMDDLRLRSRNQAEQTRTETERQVTETLHRMGVPSKEDLAELNAKVTLLTQKIDELMQSRSTGKGSADKPTDTTPMV